MSPIAIALFLYISKQADYYFDGLGKSVLQGLITGITDRLMIRGANSALNILKSKNPENPFNHDLLKSLRRSMLLSTREIRIEMKLQKQDWIFRYRLERWLRKELKQINNLKHWYDWNNPAIDKLELFFDTANKSQDKYAQYTLLMTKSWKDYLGTITKLGSLPETFVSKLENGWINDHVTIKWSELVMLNFKTYIREGNDHQSIKAGNAFVHNFLSDIKLELLERKTEEASVILTLNHVIDLLKDDFPRYRNEIENQWLAINQLVTNNKLLVETNSSQQLTIQTLSQILNQKEKERLILSETIISTTTINEELHNRLLSLTTETKVLRAQILEIYTLYPNTYRDEIINSEKTRSLYELSKEGDERRQLRKKLEIAENIFDAEIKYELGLNLHKEFRYVDALAQIRQAIALNPGSVRFEIELADLYFELQEYNQGEIILNALAHNFSSRIQEIDFDLKRKLDKLKISLHYERYRYQEILDELKQSIVDHINKYGDSEIGYLNELYVQLGMGFIYLNDIRHATKFLKKGVEMTITKYGVNSLSFCEDLNTVGVIHLNADMNLEAFKRFKYALKILSDLGIEKSPLIIKILINLSAVFLYKQKYDFALKYIHDALQMANQLYSPKNKHSAEIHSRIADIYVRMGDLEKSAIEYKKSVRIIEELDPNSVDLMVGKYLLACNLIDINQHDEASTYLDFAVDYCRKEKMFSNQSCLEILVRSALCYHYLGYKAKTDALYEEIRSSLETYKDASLILQELTFLNSDI